MTPPKHVVNEGIAPRNCDLFYFARLSFATQVIPPRTRFLPHRMFKCTCHAVECGSPAISHRVSDFKDISPGVCLDKRVEKIIQMMREDVRGELSLGEFAQSVNLSVWRLCHIFKSDVGMPPIRYLRQLRMERAKDLLESSFLSVKEIAFQVGLNDESHFVRDFKSTYGYSPALYRSQFKNNARSEGQNGSHGHGPTNGKGTQPNGVREHLVQIVKHTILPSVHLFIYVFSYLN